LKRYRVEFSPAAAAQAERIQSWWSENRPKSPGLFRRELAVAIRYLGRTPYSTVAYDDAEVLATRRLLMPRTRHYLYFIVDESTGLVRVHAVWHASRGSGPP
jgi:plasmid stabilization system protein ParE